MTIEQNTNYAYKLKYMENPTFDKVRDLAIKFMRELPKQLQDELYEALNRGVDILDSEPQMVTYLYAFGPMHQAKLNYAFKHLPEEFLAQPEINIIDYGCGQTLGTMCYADYLRENGCFQRIKTLTLIEPSEICLKRAALHASMFLHDAEIKTVNKRFDDLTSDDIMCSKEIPTLHIFSNVLDMLCFDLNQCASLINDNLKGYNQFVCVGPFFNYSDKDDRMEQFCSLLSGDNYYCKSFDKYEFEEQKAWTAHILCFAVRKPIEDSLSTEVSKTDIDNGVEDEYGVLYSIDGKRLLQYRNYQIESYSIKKGTKVICDLAFGDVLEHPCESLREIVIPDTVTKIGFGAFTECNSLQQITIPNSVVEIGDNAFWMCKSLHQVNLPNSISNIGEGAFSDCRFLRQIILPGSVSSIEKETFMGCCSLQDIIIPNSIENIEECAFYGCKSLQQVNIPNSVISVGKEAFRHCASLKRITFSNPAISVGDEALSGCLSLQQIIIPRGSSEKFKKILDEELWDKIVESSNSESIKSSNELEGLSTTFINNGIDNSVKDEFGIVYSRDGKRLLKCDNLNLENYSIPDSVRSIGSVAFSNCSLLRQIIIPVSVTSIGGGAFRGCSSLQQIIIPNSITHIGGGAFTGCKSLQQIIIPDSITNIEVGVFGSCTSLQQITIPNSVKSIGFWAFAGCKSLQRVIVPVGSTERFKKMLDEELWDKIVECETL